MVCFEYKAIIKESWEAAKNNYGRISASWGIYFFVYVIFSQIMKAFQGDGVLVFSATILSQAVMLFLSIGLIRCFLKAADGETINLPKLFSGSDVFPSFLIAHIAYLLLCSLGLILFIVPGLIWMYKYAFAVYFIADQKAGIREAFSKSAQMTDGYKWRLFVLCMVSIAINIAGFLCFGIGLFVTIPLTGMFYPIVFRLLSKGRPVECCRNENF